MFDNIEAHFHEGLVAAYRHYKEAQDSHQSRNSRDLRAAIAAASAIYHFREHLPTAMAISQKGMVSICPDYDLLKDITNVSKHANLTKNNPQISSADCFEELIVLTEYRDKDGTYVDARRQLAVCLCSVLVRLGWMVMRKETRNGIPTAAGQSLNQPTSTSSLLSSCPPSEQLGLDEIPQ